MCVRASAVRAIDVDVDDPVLSRSIEQTICHDLLFPKRTRINSHKFLIPFRLKTPLAKRIIDVGNKQRIELLADGQQWLLCGMHPSGVRYEWQNHKTEPSKGSRFDLPVFTNDRLPDDIPELQIEQLEAIWLALSTKFAVSTDTTDAIVRKDATDAPTRPAEVLTAIPDSTLRDLQSALRWPALLEAAADNSAWSEIGLALLSLGALGRELWIEFSRSAAGYEPGAPEEWWEAHKSC